MVVAAVKKNDAHILMMRCFIPLVLETQITNFRSHLQHLSLPLPVMFNVTYIERRYLKHIATYTMTQNNTMKQNKPGL
jgi:hypothetical protein